MIRVLFVCLGNICRSPMAEAIFAHQVREAGLEGKIEADSAGTGNWHVGNPPHAGTRRILAKNAIACAHRGRVIKAADLNTFDYIMTMDDSNLEDVLAMGRGTAKVSPFLEYAPGSAVREVPDPYFSGNFDEVYQLCTAASEGLLAAIRRDHHL